MTHEDEDTRPNRPVVAWREDRLRWADVNRWVKLGDPIAYARANAAGVVGVKVSEGASWSGTQAAREVVDACLEAGLVVVGYQFGPYQADAFLDAFPPRAGCIPCLDFEFSKSNVDPAAARIEAAEKWIKTVADAWKILPWFYGRSTWIDVGQPRDTLVRYCPYWGPQYGPRLVVPRGVGRAVAWQYSDGALGPTPRTHAGIEIAGGETKPCDMNVLLFTRAELRVNARLSE